jgi:CRP-like cAMP-binding protein
LKSTSHLLDQAHSLREQSRVDQAIDLLEARIIESQTPSEISELAPALAQLYWMESDRKNEPKAARYAGLAADAMIRQGRIAPALGLIEFLKSLPHSTSEALRLQRMVANSFSAPLKKKPALDDHAVPPTPFQEISGFVSLTNVDADFAREQWAWKPQRQFPLFSWLKSDQVFEFIQQLGVCRLRAAESVFQKGEFPNSFFAIAQGYVDVQGIDGSVRKVQEGEFFGELSFFSGVARRSFVSAGSGGATLIEFSRSAIHEIFTRDPRIQKKVTEFFQYRLFMNAAARHSLFRNMSPIDLDDIWKDLMTLRAQPGSVVVESSDLNSRERFFMILRGSLQGMMAGAPTATVWSPGSFCGLATGCDQIIAREPSLLLEFSREALQPKLWKYSALSKAFARSEGFDFISAPSFWSFID